MLLALIFMAVVVPAAPTNAQIRQPLPRCAEGPFNDADGNGIIDGQEGGGCPGAAHLVAEGNGYAARLEDGDLAGTMVEFTDATADDGIAIHLPSGSGLATGQVRLHTPSLPAGTYTIWIRGRVTTSGKDKIWFSTTPHLYLPGPTTAQRTDACQQAGLCSSGLMANYDWIKLSTTVTGGADRELYLTSSDSFRGDCVFISTDATGANRACPPAAVPPSADYVILESNGIPAGVADSKWAGANVVPWGGFTSTGLVGTHISKMLWDDVSNKLCLLGRINAAGLTTNTTADDDPLTGGTETSFWLDFRLDTQSLINTNAYRMIANGAATPAVFDANFPGGAQSSTLDFANLTKDRSYTSNILLVQTCFTLPATVTAGQTGSFELYSQELIGGVTRWITAGSPLQTGSLFDFPNWLTAEFSATVVGGADTTAPTIGQPNLVSNSGSAQTWTYTCTDAGSGCATGFLDWDTNSGVPYANSQSCTLSGSPANGTFTCSISGLSSGTSYFVRGRALDGSGNSGTGTEQNAATTTTTGLFLAVGGTGNMGSGCLSSNPCPLTETFINANSPPGTTWLIKNGTHHCGATACLSDATGLTVSGQPGNPITIQCETFSPGPTGTGPGCSLIGNGASWILWLNNASWWVVQGIHFENVDVDIGPNGGHGGLVYLSSATNNIIRKNIMKRANGWQSASNMVVAADGGAAPCGNLIEENDFLLGHRTTLNMQTSGSCAGSPNKVRLNYVGQQRPREPFCCSNQFGPSHGLNCYGCDNVIWENNIVEDTPSSCFDGGGVDVKWYGNIGINCSGYGHAAAASNFGLGLQTNLVIKDEALIDGPNDMVQGLLILSPEDFAIVENFTFAGTSTEAILAYQQLNSGPFGIRITNALSFGGSASYGVLNTGVFNTRILEYSNTQGSNFGLNVSNTIGGSPSMGDCKIYTPSTAGASFVSGGKNGAPLGSQAVFEYQNGVRTTTTAFDFAQSGSARGRHKYGPGVKIDVNDANAFPNGHARSNVHQRVGFGSLSTPGQTCVYP